MRSIVLALVFGAGIAAGLATAPPAGADRLYESALASCRAAAEKSEDPTDFKCDWRALVAGAPGAALTGKFTYEEEGLSGEMTVLESDGTSPALVGILTVSDDPSAHTCSASFTAARDGDALVAKPDDSDGCEFSIASGSEPDVVVVTSNEACRTYYCGMRAEFGGKWKLSDR